LCQAVDGFLAQGGCVARDFRLARPFNVRHSTIQRPDQFLELTGELARAHGHRYPPAGTVFLRKAFQISPHPLHLQ
jgi:hypothetical protein